MVCEMKRNDFDQLVLDKNKNIFESVIFFGAIISFISSYLLYSTHISYFFSCLDACIGLSMTVLYALKDQVSTSLKINIVILITVILGMIIMLDRAFVGSSFYLFILANVVGTTLLSKQKSILISCVTTLYVVIIIVAMMTGFIKFSGYDNHLNSLGEWLIHLGTYLLSLIVIYLTINGMKSHLLENIDQLEVSVEHVFKLAYYDPLTKLPNRIKFIETLLGDSKKNIQGVILLIEVKDLKMLNSINSNEFGNNLLISIADILTEIYIENNKIARVGASEFAVWIETFSESIIEIHINNTLKILDRELRLNGIDQTIEFYSSYAHYNADDWPIERCYQNAMIALEYSKNLKNIHLVAYNKEIEQQTIFDLEIKDAIKNAIENCEFQVVYQEKIDVLTGKVYGVEALARWHSKLHGEISPIVFISIIEKNNLAVSFGNMMIRMILDDVAALLNLYGKHIVVSINISPSHFMTKSFNVFIVEEIIKRDIFPNCIMLEITEEIMIEGFDIAQSVIVPLKAFGIGISLDDFGTGYSSLSYFAKMDLSELKIDKSFIDQINESKKVKALIKAIIQLANLYEVAVVAEGVETKEQLDALIELGCYLIQGYYFSTPQPINNCGNSN